MMQRGDIDGETACEGSDHDSDFSTGCSPAKMRRWSRSKLLLSDGVFLAIYSANLRKSPSATKLKHLDFIGIPSLAIKQFYISFNTVTKIIVNEV